MDLCAIFDSHDFQDSTLWTTFSPKQVPNNTDRFIPERSLPRPCPSRNHDNYCDVGTYWFFKARFSLKMLINFRICLFSVSFFLPSILITIFHKTTVNVYPLSPPVFEKIAPQLYKNGFFFMLVLCVCVFCCCFFIDCRWAGTLVLHSPTGPRGGFMQPMGGSHTRFWDSKTQKLKVIGSRVLQIWLS